MQKGAMKKCSLNLSKRARAIATVFSSYALLDRAGRLSNPQIPFGLLKKFGWSR
jgi:hypothetical protein